MDRTELNVRLEFRRAALTELRKAHLALVSGQVQSYSIGSRILTKLNLPELKDEIDDMEKEVDELTSVLNGGGRRKAVGVIPRDW